MNRPDFKEIIALAKADTRILAVFLFGSVARGDSKDKSDVDICLVLEPRCHNLKDISRIRLDYLSSFTFDIHIFQQLPLYIQKRVIQEGQILFCREEDALYALVFKMIREYASFEHIYRDYLTEVLHG